MTPVAYMWPVGDKWLVLCAERCAPLARQNGSDFGCPLVTENFGDYRQSCHECGKIFSMGKTALWPVLFDAPANRVPDAYKNLKGGRF